VEIWKVVAVYLLKTAGALFIFALQLCSAREVGGSLGGNKKLR
jgi:hypothetical protein